MKRVLIFLLTYIRRFSSRRLIKKLYLSDFKYAIKEYRGSCSECKDKSDADIMLLMHALEKGMSFPKKKEEYGKLKALELIELLKRHESQYGIDSQFTSATNILQEYLQDEHSVHDYSVRNTILSFLDQHKTLLSAGIGGVKPVVAPSFSITYNQLMDFTTQRFSVRSFSTKPISAEEIQRAISYAETSPSACNRQASRVYVLKNKAKIQSVLDCQLGDQGWCTNADTLFITTIVSTYFGNQFERQQPFIDGGIFAMNLVLGLHVQAIASCFKMYVRSPQNDIEVRKIVSIPENEIPIVLIFAGHYPEESCYSPMSRRYPIKYEIQ